MYFQASAIRYFRSDRFFFFFFLVHLRLSQAPSSCQLSTGSSGVSGWEDLPGGSEIKVDTRLIHRSYQSTLHLPLGRGDATPTLLQFCRVNARGEMCWHLIKVSGLRPGQKRVRCRDWFSVVKTNNGHTIPSAVGSTAASFAKKFAATWAVRRARCGPTFVGSLRWSQTSQWVVSLCCMFIMCRNSDEMWWHWFTYVLAGAAAMMIPVFTGALLVVLRVNDFPNKRRFFTSDVKLHGKTVLITGSKKYPSTPFKTSQTWQNCVACGQHLSSFFFFFFFWQKKKKVEILCVRSFSSVFSFEQAVTRV